MPATILTLLRLACAAAWLVAASGALAQTEVPRVSAQSVFVFTQADRIAPDGEVVRATLPDTVRAAASAAPPFERRWRVVFDAPVERAGLALYLPGAIGHVRIELNGANLLDTITTPLGPPPRSIQLLRFVELPPHLLRASGNRVEITLRGSRGASLSSSSPTAGR
jgi:hypothetical protein